MSNVNNGLLSEHSGSESDNASSQHAFPAPNIWHFADCVEDNPTSAEKLEKWREAGRNLKKALDELQLKSVEPTSFQMLHSPEKNKPNKRQDDLNKCTTNVILDHVKPELLQCTSSNQSPSNSRDRNCSGGCTKDSQSESNRKETSSAAELIKRISELKQKYGVTTAPANKTSVPSDTDDVLINAENPPTTNGTDTLIGDMHSKHLLCNHRKVNACSAQGQHMKSKHPKMKTLCQKAETLQDFEPLYKLQNGIPFPELSSANAKDFSAQSSGHEPDMEKVMHDLNLSFRASPYYHSSATACSRSSLLNMDLSTVARESELEKSGIGHSLQYSQVFAHSSPTTNVSSFGENLHCSPVRGVCGLYSNVNVNGVTVSNECTSQPSEERVVDEESASSGVVSPLEDENNPPTSSSTSTDNHQYTNPVETTARPDILKDENLALYKASCNPNTVESEAPTVISVTAGTGSYEPNQGLFDRAQINLPPTSPVFRINLNHVSPGYNQEHRETVNRVFSDLERNEHDFDWSRVNALRNRYGPSLTKKLEKENVNLPSTSTGCASVASKKCNRCPHRKKSNKTQEQDKENARKATGVNDTVLINKAGVIRPEKADIELECSATDLRNQTARPEKADIELECSATDLKNRTAVEDQMSAVHAFIAGTCSSKAKPCSAAYVGTNVFPVASGASEDKTGSVASSLADLALVQLSYEGGERLLPGSGTNIDASSLSGTNVDSLATAESLLRTNTQDTSSQGTSPVPQHLDRSRYSQIVRPLNISEASVTSDDLRLIPASDEEDFDASDFLNSSTDINVSLPASENNFKVSLSPSEVIEAVHSLDISSGSSDAHSDSDSSAGDLGDDEFECDCELCRQEMLSLREGRQPTATQEVNVPRGPSPTDPSTGVVDPENRNDDFTTARLSDVTPPDADLPNDSVDLLETVDSVESVEEIYPVLPDGAENIPDLNPFSVVYLTLYGLEANFLEHLFQSVVQHMLEVFPDLASETPTPPITQQQFEEIPVVKMTAELIERDRCCPICLCEFELDENCKQLGCHHIFHPLCIQAWFNRVVTCPVCRRQELAEERNA